MFLVFAYPFHYRVVFYIHGRRRVLLAPATVLLLVLGGAEVEKFCHQVTLLVLPFSLLVWLGQADTVVSRVSVLAYPVVGPFRLLFYGLE